MTKKLVCSAAILACFLGSASLADDKKQSKAEKRMARVEERFQPTGSVKNCVSIRSLRDSTVIDDQTIFFDGPGKFAYINRLPRRCPRLASEQRFSFSTSIGQLCKSEIITVLDSMGQSWSSCGLGKFEEWEKKKKSDKKADK